MVTHFSTCSINYQDGVLKSPTVAVVLSISHCAFLFLFHVFIAILLVHKHLKVVMPSRWTTYYYDIIVFIPGNIMCSEIYVSDINIATSVFFWLVLAQFIFTHLFTFKEFVFLYLKGITYRQYIFEIYLYIQSISAFFSLIN